MNSWQKLIGFSINSIPSAFEQAMARETLRNERLRVLTVAIFMGLISVVYISVISSLPSFVDALGGRELPLWLPLLIFGAGIGYEVAIYVTIGRLLAHGYGLHRWIRYVNVFVETSAPTLILILSAYFLGPLNSLLSPIQLVYFFFILLSTLRLDVGLCLFTGGVAAIEYIIFSLLLLPLVGPDQGTAAMLVPAFYVSRGVIFFGGGVLAALISRQLRGQFSRALQAFQEQERVTTMFGQYVSPTVAQEVLARDETLAGEVRHVCVMFLDIRDFSRYSDQRDPREVVEYLNRLFAELVEIVHQHQGFINKFLGDGFMAVFGAPLPDPRATANAVAAANAMLTRAAELSASGAIPPTRLGIGLHAGEAVTGNVGSALRKEYTIIGDVVNLAARLEQLNKQYNAQLLVSQTVWQTVAADQPSGAALGPVAVKGFAEPVEVYRLR